MGGSPLISLDPPKLDIYCPKRMSKMRGSKGIYAFFTNGYHIHSHIQNILKNTRTPQKCTMWNQKDFENAFFILHHFVSQKRFFVHFFGSVIRPQDFQNAFSSGLRMSNFWTLKILGSRFLEKNEFRCILE